MTLQAVFPHAHLLCKEIEVTATLPDGKNIPVIWIKNWDWDWQDEYLYQKPLEIPRGTQVHMRFRFDNSSDNIKDTPPSRREECAGASKRQTRWLSASSRYWWIGKWLKLLTGGGRNAGGIGILDPATRTSGFKRWRRMR